MYFAVPIDKLFKSKYDAYIEGILFDKEGKLAVNIFTNGNSVVEIASTKYIIMVEELNSKLGKTRDLLVTKVHKSPILIVSKKFKTFLEKNFTGLAEFFPVEFDKVNNSPLFDYFICNVLSKFDCADYGFSELFYEDPDDQEGESGIDTINSLTLDYSKIPPNSHFFLLGNICTPVLIASEKFKHEIESSELNGLQFHIPEEFIS